MRPGIETTRFMAYCWYAACCCAVVTAVAGDFPGGIKNENEAELVQKYFGDEDDVEVRLREGGAPVKAASRASLRLLGSVGEPINPEAWLWYHRVVGDGRCPIVDTWWQTETGGILMTPLPGATPSATG